MVVFLLLSLNAFHSLQTEQTLGDLLALINLKEFPNPVRVAEVDTDLDEFH